MAMEKSKCTPGKSNANASNKVKLSKKVQKKLFSSCAGEQKDRPARSEREVGRMYNFFCEIKMEIGLMTT